MVFVGLLESFIGFYRLVPSVSLVKKPMTLLVLVACLKTNHKVMRLTTED